ncbi:MAG TPA: hypothetical protein VF746_14925 [Longimicrobium sp.]
MNRRLPLRLALAACALGAAVPATAQQTPPRPEPGPYARIVVLQPRPGQQAAFEAGYQRHLEWHRGANDPWTWYGWSFVLGERIGLFMDGTFGHAAADFDAAVQPAADAADNAANVSPYADFLGHGVYERLDALGRGAPLPDTSAFLALTTYRVAPGRERAFAAALAAHHARRQGDPAARYTWFRLRIGGQAPEYLLMRPVRTFAAAATLPDFFEAAPEGGAAGIAGLVESVRSELLRYRPTLSYRP